MDNLWRDDEASALEGIDLLVYRSRLIGRDDSLVLRGGGNTSIKQVETDFRGRQVRVMRIKGSGSDLRTIEPRDFPGIRLDDLEPLYDRAAMTDDEMVDWLVHCLMDPGSPRPSIETLLHGFVPHPHVDHTHADAILVLTNTGDGRRHVAAALGEEAVWIPYRRPGFLLSREVGAAVRAHPKARCVVLEKHGLITWGETARASYDATIEFNGRAEEYAHDRARTRSRPAFGAALHPPLSPDVRRRVAARLMPWLRGLLSGRDAAADPAGGDALPPGAAATRPAPGVVLRFDDSDDVLEFVGSEAGPQICLAGPATPDHLMYTRPRPLFVHEGLPSDPDGEAGLEALKAAVGAALQRYVAWYDLYFRKNSSGGETRLERWPRVILIPGVGMLTAWKDARHARLAADVYHHTIGVMRAAQGIGEYRSLDIRDSFEIEYWPLEVYRMSLAPPEQELARRVAMVTGAASGIGRGIARRLAAEGCHIVATDLRAEAVDEVAREIATRHGEGRAVGVAMDVTVEADVEHAFEAAAAAYGGVDIVVSNAGTAHSSSIERMALRDWQRSLDVNATGHFLVARAAMRLQREQGLGGSLVFIASKNVLAPGRDFGAYSAAKAAECQLARVLAIEGGECGVRANMINPDAIFQDSHLWSEAVRQERARAHGIQVEELEEFYRRRNLLRTRVTAEDVAEAALWLATDRSARTTGCILTVDGGVREAFPR